MGPLHGVRILDLSRLFPGPYATLLLADLGAHVVKVEDTKGGDYIRYFPPHASDGNGAAFHALNRGKDSIALDLASDDDKATFLALVARADVVIESFRPGVLEKLGLAPAVLLSENPSLVVCRISGFGQEGPLAKRAGHDLGYAARAGVLGMMKAPSTLPVQVADLCGGAWPAALQIVAALYGRTTTGKGAVIDVSMTDGAHAMLVMPYARLGLVDEDVSRGRDLLVGSVPCYDVYETRDGHLAVGALEPKFWMAFCAATELVDLASDGLSTGDAGEAVRARVAARLKEKTTAEWTEVLAPFDCCVEPVLSPEEARASMRERGLFVDVDIGGAQVSLPCPPLSLAGDRCRSAGPALGSKDARTLWNEARPSTLSSSTKGV
jgi:alpha-methylacyl-CoA racemase